MACSSGTSSGSSTGIQNSERSKDHRHDDHVQQIMDQRKRKRMQSNRESARRSQMRKQKHLEDLTAQLGKIRRENNQIISNMNITTQLYQNLEAENSILRAQMAELSHSLQSLDEIIRYLNSSGSDGIVNNSWSSSLVMNQAIMAASDDLFMC